MTRIDRSSASSRSAPTTAAIVAIVATGGIRHPTAKGSRVRTDGKIFDLTRPRRGRSSTRKRRIRPIFGVN